MKAAPSILVCGIALTACAGPQLNPAQQAQTDAATARNAAIQECRSKYPERKRGQAAEAIRCMNKANSLYQPPEIADLIRLASAKTLDAAERFDAGKITDAQLELEVAAIDAEFQNAARSRFNQQMAISAAQQQATALRQQAAMQGIMAGAAIMATPPPAPLPPPTRQTNCATLGNNTNCTTW